MENNEEKLAYADGRIPFEKPIVIGEHGQPFMMLPNDFALKDVEEFLERPHRIEKLFDVSDIDSFINYVADYYKDEASSIIQVDREERKLLAVLDYHTARQPHASGGTSAAVPAHCKHMVRFYTRRTKNWKLWLEHNGRFMGQTTFAEFIEDNIDDFVDPPGVSLIELAVKFRSIKEVKFSSSANMRNGEFSINWSEENRKGSVEFPEIITLGLQPFDGGKSYKVKARIRYRVKDAELSLSYKLQQPEKVEEDAFDAMVDKIAGHDPVGELRRFSVRL